MKKRIALLGIGVCALAFAAEPPAKPPEEKPAADGKPADAKPEAMTAATAKSVLDFTMKDIDGKDVPLSKYKGQALIIVNVASKCGYTKQYKQLEEVYEKYKGRGLRILAFPANNFGNQEPGSEAEIKEFCSKEYNVRFDLFAKVSVKGDDQCELYKFLTSKEKNPKSGIPIAWNFTKYIIDREGKIVARFEPKVPPDAPIMIEEIEKALGEEKGSADPKAKASEGEKKNQ